MASEQQHITIAEALAAVDAATFTIGGRRIIHTFAGMIGADWDADDSVAFIARSSGRAWVDHLLGHDLSVLVDGRVVYFDVKRPAGT